MSNEETLRRLRMDGWSVVEGVIPDDEVEDVRRSIVETAGKHGTGGTRNAVRGLIAYDQSLAPYLTSSKVLGVVEAVFGSNVRASMTTALVTESGQERGGWHSDWPFGQMQARHLPAPYPDVTAHLTTIWMLTPFTLEGGGTLLVPGSHRASNNPSDDNMGVDDMDSYPTEVQATGSAGSVLIFDSRLWHSTAANDSGETRVAVVVRWAPWWLNVNPITPGTAEYEALAEETGNRPDDVVLISPVTHDRLPDAAKPLFRHLVAR